MNAPSRIEGYAIVSDNGMISTAKGAMPRALKFDADQQFFERGLNGVDVVARPPFSRTAQTLGHAAQIDFDAQGFVDSERCK
jgi:hypothetical protein